MHAHKCFLGFCDLKPTCHLTHAPRAKSTCARSIALPVRPYDSNCLFVCAPLSVLLELLQFCNSTFEYNLQYASLLLDFLAGFHLMIACGWCRPLRLFSSGEFWVHARVRRCGAAFHIGFMRGQVSFRFDSAFRS
eukprot:6214054-Pleurochrysis_carterae.AAC.2